MHTAHQVARWTERTKSGPHPDILSTSNVKAVVESIRPICSELIAFAEQCKRLLTELVETESREKRERCVTLREDARTILLDSHEDLLDLSESLKFQTSATHCIFAI